jgi:hypothetical protein
MTDINKQQKFKLAAFKAEVDFVGHSDIPISVYI